MMKVGLLWFDDDPRRAIEDKVRRAAKRYRGKFGRAANTCYVNPVSLEGHNPLKDGFRCGRVKVIASPKVSPPPFLVGRLGPLAGEEGAREGSVGGDFKRLKEACE